MGVCRNYTLKMFDPYNQIVALSSTGYDAGMEHTHDFIELVYVTEGALLHGIRGKRICVKKGDLFAISSTDAHSMTPVGDPESCQWINCIVKKELFQDQFSDLDPGRCLSSETDPEIQSIMMDLLEEYQCRRPYYQEVLQGYVLSLLAKLRRSCLLEKECGGTAVRGGPCQKSLYINRAVQFMSRNYRKKLRLEDIAKAVGISAGYLDRIFREERSTTPIEYLNLFRVTVSCVLLVNTNLPISEICEEVGFHDLKFFYTLFKLKNGQSPGAYRNSKRKDPILLSAGEQKAGPKREGTI